MRKPWTAILIAVAFVGTTGCERHIPSKELEKKTKKWLKEQLEGVDVENVDCPKKVKLEEGNEFECTATLEGDVELTLEVEQTDNRGSVEWNVKEGVVISKKLEKKIKKALKEKGVATKIDCGKPVRVAKPDDTFECTAEEKESGKKHTVECTIENKDGDVKWKVVQ